MMMEERDDDDASLRRSFQRPRRVAILPIPNKTNSHSSYVSKSNVEKMPHIVNLALFNDWRGKW